MKSIYLSTVLLLVFGFVVACAQQTDRYAPLPGWYQDYDVVFYKIDIEADNSSVNIKGNVGIMAKIKVPALKQFTLELAEGVLVDSVWLDGQSVQFRRDGDLLYALPSGNLLVDEMCTVVVFYEKKAGQSKGDSFFSGISNRTDTSWDMPVTWTLSEPNNAKDWFPCKQHPADKADSAYVFITVPAHLKAGAPGRLTAVTPMPGGKMRYEWKTRYTTAYHLLSFAVSDYTEYNLYAHPEGISDPVLIQNYIYNKDGYLAANKAVIDSTAALIELYSKLFIPYPFANEKYGHCVAPMGGGMEHQTMTTISEFDFLLVAHELAHQWFGNLVTCASFQDIWVNEGFASYSEYLALQHMASQKEADEWMQGAHAMACWSQKGSIFVPKESADDTWRIFSMSLSYKKGAALVHHIRYMINNDAVFFDVLRTFLHRYAHSSATAMDFKAVVEEKSGIDFALFFDQWYFGEGFPIFDISWTSDGERLKILVNQSNSTQSDSFFVTDMDIQIKRINDVDTIVRLSLSQHSKLFEFTIPDVSGIEVDPQHYIVKDIRSNTQVKDLPTDDLFISCNAHVNGKQDLAIRFSKPTSRNCLIRLTDVTGEKTFSVVSARQKESLVIPMTDLPNGSYLLYIKDNKEQYVRKVVKTAF